VPRGFGEPGVSAEDNARKELREEINGTAAELIDLGVYHNNTGSEGNQVELFFARMESVGEPASQEGIQRVEWVNVSRLEEMIAGGEITDGFTIAAYTRCKLRGLI
jgi:ADP-ribose pyrophosphatase